MDRLQFHHHSLMIVCNHLKVIRLQSFVCNAIFKLFFNIFRDFPPPLSLNQHPLPKQKIRCNTLNGASRVVRFRVYTYENRRVVSLALLWCRHMMMHLQFGCGFPFFFSFLSYFCFWPSDSKTLGYSGWFFGLFRTRARDGRESSKQTHTRSREV